MTTSPSVVRVWIPTILGATVCLFLQHMSPVYWLFASPVLLILIFMVTLAEIHDEGPNICVRLLWKSRHIPREDVLRSDRSFLDGIGVLRLRHFVFPWGPVFFVYEWSTTREKEEEASFFSDLLVSAVLAISGFVAARAGDIGGLKIEAPQARILGLVSAGVLCVLFAVARRKASSFANFLLFVAAYLVGLVRW